MTGLTKKQMTVLWIVIIGTLMLSSCVHNQSTPQPTIIATNGPPILPSLPKSKALVNSLVAPTKKPVDRYIVLSYRSDSSNFLWQLQESYDNKAWSQAGPKLTDNPRPWTWSNQLWWVGSPGTNIYTVYMSNQPIKFWRTYGVSP